MNPSNDFLQLLCGVITPEAYAERHGLTVEQALELRERGLSRMNEVLHPRPSRGPWLVASAAIALFLIMPTVASGQLVTFVADAPAQAAQVNYNFATLRRFIEVKTGALPAIGTDGGVVGNVGAGALTSASVSAGTITATTSFNGPLTGNVTGNVSGNLTGSVTGNVTGNLTGNVTGNVTGNINNVNIRRKGGNNGTVNCDTYCFNSGFGGFSGACLGIQLPSGQFSADCGYAPGLLTGQELGCLCATF